MTSRDQRGDHWNESMVLLGTCWTQQGNTMWPYMALPGLQTGGIGFRTVLTARQPR